MFQLLRDGRPRTRADLAAVTGQARSTVAARIDLLMAAGLIAPAGEATSTGGRPPATFAFAPSARVVLGVDLGATHARLALTDLASTVLAQRDLPLLITDGPDLVLDRVAETGAELLHEAGRTTSDLAGVGVGLPGPWSTRPASRTTRRSCRAGTTRTCRRSSAPGSTRPCSWTTT